MLSGKQKLALLKALLGAYHASMSRVDRLLLYTLHRLFGHPLCQGSSLAVALATTQHCWGSRVLKQPTHTSGEGDG